MYKILTIGGQDYKLEYTVEASLYEEGIERLIGFLGKTSVSFDEEELKGLPKEEQIEIRKRYVMENLSGVSNIPSLALSVFYAGLMEHHGASGDKTVRSKDDAKELVRQYFDDHKNDGTDNFYDILLICMEQMGEDNFFKRTGLEKVMEQAAKNNEQSTGNREQRRAEAKASGKQS